VPPSPHHLTLAIPYFRNRDYLPRAVASVLAQGDPRWKLIVADGGGDPGGPVEAIVHGYRDSRVSFLPSAGRPTIAGNWNRCIDAAETDLVTLLHDDDELRPGYVGRMLAAADAYPTAAVLFCEAEVIGPAGERRFSFPDYVKRFYRPRRGRPVVVEGEAGLRAVLAGNFIMCPTMCFRKSRLGSRRFAERWAQVLDLDLTGRLLLDGDMLMGVPDALYAYRRHPASATAEQTRTLLRFREEIQLFGELAAAGAKTGWWKAAATGRSRTILKLNLGFCVGVDLVRGRWSAAGEKAGLLARLWATAG
jgi:glycosyltransferase involved in cell wall biosynthesis